MDFSPLVFYQHIYYIPPREKVKEKLLFLLPEGVESTICCGATKYWKLFLQFSLQKIVVP
jgi:hypothetical protein